MSFPPPYLLPMPDTRAALLDLIAARPGLSQGEVADRAGVSTRTARRYLQPLVREGTVLVEADGPARRYRLADHAHPVAAPPPTFTEGETEALVVAVLAARPLLAPTPLAGRLDALAEKLRHGWLGEVVLFDAETDAAHWHFDGDGVPPEPAAPALFRALLDAARGQHPVRATYYTASRDETREGRRLAPLGFLIRGGTWQVPSADLDDPSRKVKDFALAGFRAVTLLGDEVALRPDGFDLAAFAAGRFGAHDGEAATVRLLVEAEALPYFRRKRYAPSQRIEEERADGRAVVSFEARGMDAVKAWCLSWGPKVKVLEPPALAEAVATAHREAALRYSDLER